MEKKLIPEVLQVVPGKGYSFYAYFNDGTVHYYDASSLVQNPGVFQKLKDQKVFHDCLTVMNGTAAWDLEGKRNPRRCIDLDPYDVYEAPVVKDPLETVA